MPQNHSSGNVSAIAAVAAVRIFVVERDPAARLGLRAFFAQECPGWQVCGEVENAREALARCLSAMPEVVLVDPEIEGGGWTFLRQMSQLLPQVPCVARLRQANAEVVLAAHAEGVRSFASQADPLRDTAEAIGQARLGNDFMSLAIRAALLKGALSKPVKLADETRLTRREREVYEGISWGWPVRIIAEKLGIESKTVHSHCASIKRKLRLHSMDALRHRAALAIT